MHYICLDNLFGSSTHAPCGVLEVYTSIKFSELCKCVARHLLNIRFIFSTACGITLTILGLYKTLRVTVTGFQMRKDE